MNFALAALMLTCSFYSFLPDGVSANTVRPLPTLTQRVEFLEDRFALMEASNYQGQISSLSEYIASEMRAVRNEINSTQTKVEKYIQDQVNYLYSEDLNTYKQIDVVKGGVAALDAQLNIIGGISESVPGIVEKVSHLESVNQKWRQNFIVINTTFDQLRKKNIVG